MYPRKRRDDANEAKAVSHDITQVAKPASPPSTAYKFKKSFRRNKLFFVAGMAVAGALLIGLFASTWQSVRATWAERSASAALEELQKAAPTFAEHADVLAGNER